MVALWWIGNAIFVLVVIPVVVVLLHRLMKTVVGIGELVDTVYDQAGGISSALDGVPKLLQTRSLVKQVGGGLVRYATAVDRLL